MSTIDPIGLPVGSIICYAGSLKLLPDNWSECDGSSYSTQEYTDLFAMIGHSVDGGTGDQFSIPNLQGRFPRGDDEKKLAGKSQGWTTAAPKQAINCELSQLATSKHYTLKSLVGPNYLRWEDGSRSKTVSGGDSETRPVNCYLYYIIKIKNAPSQTDDVPVGGVVPFAAADGATPATFPEYIRCDGSKADISRVQTLFDVVGSRFSDDPTPRPTKFHAPDLRGQFVRGIDPTTDNDPDSGRRLPAPDGAKYGLGTVQLYGTKFNNMSINIPHFSDYSHHSDDVLGYACIEDTDFSRDQKWTGGDIETRPKNAALHYFINSVDPAKSKQVFPIGCIIAIPGPPADVLDQTSWQICDGSSLSTKLYSDLFGVIGSTWGMPEETDQKFLVPNLQSYYLRAADVSGAINGDPNWSERTPAPGNSNTLGPGTYQGQATGMPMAKNLVADVSYATKEKDTTMASSVWTDESGAAGGHQLVPFTFAADAETKPATVVVNFYIRAL